MRRVATLTGGVALAASVLFVTPVSAAPSQRYSDTQSVLFCEELTGDGGTAFLIAGESEQFGSFSDAAFWPPDAPPPENPAWIAMNAEVDFTASSVSGTILMVEYAPSPEGPPFGDPVGNAVLVATLTADGGPEPYSIHDNSGNQVIRQEGVVQAYTVEGTLTMPNDAGVFDLSSCEAFTDTFTAFNNAPASFVSRFSSVNLDCFWESEIGFVNLHAEVGEFGEFTDMFIFQSEEEAFFGEPSGPLTLTTEAFEASFDLVDANEGGDPVGSAAATATLTPGGRINDSFAFENFKTHIVGQGYLVDGSLTVTLGSTTTVLSMDESSCSAGDVVITNHESAAQGPKGRPLANDTPEGALPIEVGETVTVRKTLGAALEPEAPCILSDPEGDFEVFFGHTAWWTFTGTGSPVTVDTAGSDFDTVVAIYVDDEGALTQVGCVDDTEESLEAQITIPTEAGVTYWIQAGGFGGESGTLVLTVE